MLWVLFLQRLYFRCEKVLGLQDMSGQGVCGRAACSSLHLICSSLMLGSGSRRKPRV
jgi:hypothetical protein